MGLALTYCGGNPQKTATKYQEPLLLDGGDDYYIESVDAPDNPDLTVKSYLSKDGATWEEIADISNKRFTKSDGYYLYLYELSGDTGLLRWAFADNCSINIKLTPQGIAKVGDMIQLSKAAGYDLSESVILTNAAAFELINKDGTNQYKTVEENDSLVPQIYWTIYKSTSGISTHYYQAQINREPFGNKFRALYSTYGKPSKPACGGALFYVEDVVAKAEDTNTYPGITKGMTMNSAVYDKDTQSYSIPVRLMFPNPRYTYNYDSSYELFKVKGLSPQIIDILPKDCSIDMSKEYPITIGKDGDPQ